MSDFLRHSGKISSTIALLSLGGILAALSVLPGSYSKLNQKEQDTLHLLAGLIFGSTAVIAGSGIACSLAGWEDSKLKAAVSSAKKVCAKERAQKAVEHRHAAAITAIDLAAEQSRAGMIAAMTGGFATPTEEQQLTSQILPHIEPVLIQYEMMFDQVFSSQFGYAVRLVPGGTKGQAALLDQGSKEFKALEVQLRSRLGDLVILPSGKGSLTAYVFNDQAPVSDNPRDFICDFAGVTSIPRKLGQIVQVLGDPMDALESLITSLSACGEFVGLAVMNGDQRAISRYQDDPRLLVCESQTGVRVATNPDLIVSQLQKNVTTLIVLGACSADELAGKGRQIFVFDDGKYGYKPNAVLDLRTFPLLQMGYERFPVFIMSHHVTKRIEPTALKTIVTPEVIQAYVKRCAEFVAGRYQESIQQDNPEIAANAIDLAIEQLRQRPEFTAQSEEQWRMQILSKAETIVFEMQGV